MVQIPADAGKVKICTGHTRPICHVCYSRVVDGTYWFVTSCHDMRPMIRNGETGDWVGTFEGHKGAVYGSAFNEEATRLATGSGDYTAIVWNAITGAKLHQWEHPHYIKSCAWKQGDVMTGNFDSHIRLFDASDYEAEPRLIRVSAKSVVKACYFMDQPSLVVTACEQTVSLWDLRMAVSDGSSVATPVRSREVEGLNVLDYTEGSPFLVAAHGKSISLFRPTSLEEHITLTTAEEVECASLSMDGTRLAAGSKLKAKEFDIKGTELESHRGHHGPIFHIRWAPDDTTFSSGAEDGMVRIWPSHIILAQLQE